MTWFMEIVCAAVTIGCLSDPNPNPPIERYYKTKGGCYKAALVADQKFNVKKDDWRIRCLRIKK